MSYRDRSYVDIAKINNPKPIKTTLFFKTLTWCSCILAKPFVQNAFSLFFSGVCDQNLNLLFRGIENNCNMFLSKYQTASSGMKSRSKHDLSYPTLY